MICWIYSSFYRWWRYVKESTIEGIIFGVLWNGIYVFHLYYFFVKTFSLFATIESDLGSVYWAEVLDKERMSVAIAWI